MINSPSRDVHLARQALAAKGVDTVESLLSIRIHSLMQLFAEEEPRRCSSASRGTVQDVYRRTGQTALIRATTSDY